MITKISIRNFKRFESFQLECKAGLNPIVGNNDAGKSTLLEAISVSVQMRRGDGSQRADYVGAHVTTHG